MRVIQRVLLLAGLTCAGCALVNGPLAIAPTSAYAADQAITEGPNGFSQRVVTMDPGSLTIINITGVARTYTLGLEGLFSGAKFVPSGQSASFSVPPGVWLLESSSGAKAVIVAGGIP